MWLGLSALARIARIGGSRPLSSAFARGVAAPVAAPALAHAARLATPQLINLEQRSGLRCSNPDLRVALGLAAAAGVLLSVQPSGAAECAPKRKGKAAAAPPAKKKAGPTFGAIEAALQLEDGEYNVEKILADRLLGGRKEYLIKWEGYAEKHNSWEPLENLPNLVAEIAEYHKAKDQANADHVRRLAAEKAAREAARGGAAGSGVTAAAAVATDAATDAAVEVKSESKKTSRVYEAYEPDPTQPGYYLCKSKENTPGGCVCGDSIKGYTQSLWTHLAGKHKRTWQELKGLFEQGAPVDDEQQRRRLHRTCCCAEPLAMTHGLPRLIRTAYVWSRISSISRRGFTRIYEFLTRSIKARPERDPNSRHFSPPPPPGGGCAGPPPSEPPQVGTADRYNLLIILGQFVSHFVSARISDVSGILIHRSRTSEIILYQLCISDVSANYIISS